MACERERRKPSTLRIWGVPTAERFGVPAHISGLLLEMPPRGSDVPASDSI